MFVTQISFKGTKLIETRRELNYELYTPWNFTLVLIIETLVYNWFTQQF
jgi:hypothetical protein